MPYAPGYTTCFSVDRVWRQGLRFCSYEPGDAAETWQSSLLALPCRCRGFNLGNFGGFLLCAPPTYIRP
jgi:hypothetical protein